MENSFRKELLSAQSDDEVIATIKKYEAGGLAK
jgi:mannitol/fructose-specific phosphotransferase system IIA component (Ntr-type)